MLRKILKFNQVSHALWVLILMLLSSMVQLQNGQADATPIQNRHQSVTEKTFKNLQFDSPLRNEQKLSPLQEQNSYDLGLVEVKESEIPEGTAVYVSEEPKDGQPEEGELLETANNIVFRPLFRYKNKQEALRRTSTGVRRRYFVPKRRYRNAYYPNRRFYTCY